MAYTVRIDFSSGTKEYPILQDGFKLTELVGERGEHASQSVAVSIRSVEATGLLLADTNAFIPARIFNGGTMVFRGVIRPYVSTQVQYTTEDPLQIEVIDPTEIMHKRVYEDLSAYVAGGIDYTGVILVPDPVSNHTLSQIVSTIFTMAGITDTVTFLSGGNETVEYFVLRDGDYLDEVLANILYQYNYDFRFTASGVEIFSTNLTTQVSGTIDEFKNRMKVTREDDTTDGVVVSFQDYRVARGVQIVYDHYKHTYDWDDVLHKTDAFIYGHDSGYCWNGKFGRGSKPDKDTLNYHFNLGGYDSGDNRAVALGNYNWTFELHGEQTFDPNDSYIVHRNESFKNRGAYAYIRYSEIFGATQGFTLRCYADITYLSTADTRVGRYGTDPDTISAPFVGNINTAKALAQNHYSRIKSSSMKYEFSSFESYNPGAFYTLRENMVSGITQKVRIISRSLDPVTGLYSYKAEGADTVAMVVPELPVAGETANDDDVYSIRAVVTRDTVTSASDTVFVTAEGYLLETADRVEILLNGQNVANTTSVTLPGSAFVGGDNTVTVRFYKGTDGIEDSVIVTRILSEGEIKEIAGENATPSVSIYASDTLVEICRRTPTSVPVHVYGAKKNVTGEIHWFINGTEKTELAGLDEFTFNISTATDIPYVIMAKVGDVEGVLTINRYNVDVPEYLGILSTPPADGFIEGDYYFNPNDTIVYMYSGSEWIPTSGETEDWDVMARSVVGDAAFPQNADLSEASIVTLYVRNVAANKVVANAIKATEGFFDNLYVNGILDNDALTTEIARNEVQIGLDLTPTYKDYDGGIHDVLPGYVVGNIVTALSDYQTSGYVKAIGTFSIREDSLWFPTVVLVNEPLSYIQIKSDSFSVICANGFNRTFDIRGYYSGTMSMHLDSLPATTSQNLVRSLIPKTSTDSVGTQANMFANVYGKSVVANHYFIGSDRMMTLVPLGIKANLSAGTNMTFTSSAYSYVCLYIMLAGSDGVYSGHLVPMAMIYNKSLSIRDTRYITLTLTSYTNLKVENVSGYYTIQVYGVKS